MTVFDVTAVPSYVDQLRLDGRRLLVIGAGQGIGRQTAHAFGQAGAIVGCVDIDSERAGRVASEVGGVAIVGDVTRRQGVADVVGEAIARLGGIDGYADIVGMGLPSTLLDASDEFFDAQFTINFRHAVLLVQLVGPQMTGPGGTIVHIVSDCGRGSSPGQVAYGAAKAALISLVRSAAIELAPSGVRVNAVSPGLILTPRVSATMSPEALATLADNAPLGRNGSPSDIAAAVLFLMSPLAGYITGQVLVVDGGVDVKFSYPVPAPTPGPGAAPNHAGV
jgi:NAD(P)-dependent dehydrogenase (short-subunit alcohol dehydrogenase family)